jgi:hypothetical protein
VEHFLIPLTQLSNLYLSRTIPVKVKAIIDIPMTDYHIQQQLYVHFQQLHMTSKHFLLF